MNRLAGLLLSVVLASAAPALGREIVIQDFDAQIEVRTDSTLVVTETIRAQFTGEWNGIIRSIAYRYEFAGRPPLTTPLTVQSVEDDQGQRLEHWASREGRQVVIKIRVPGARDATRTVVIVYRLAGVILTNEQPGLGPRNELYWNVTGSDWPFPILTSHARVRLPAAIGREEVRYASYTGPYGSTGTTATARWDGNELRFDNLDSLDPGEGLTIVVDFPAGHLRPSAADDSQAAIKGALKVWHPIEVWFAGPQATETDELPNPFLDYRLQVQFTGPSGQAYNVPGFFDGDGEGDGTGNVWKVRFSPDEVGEWTYRASFREGEQVAVALEPDAGDAASFDGKGGSFEVSPLDPQAPGFLKWGRLEYVGKHYLKFRNGPYWIKGGTDSPENLLAYTDFDNQKTGTPFGEHDWSAHVGDWKPGDPTWSDGRGKGIIGLLNYLSSAHVNSIYFLPMNMGGDGQDTVPFVGYENIAFDKTHYDVGKLAQWNIVLNHAQEKGIKLQFVLAETEEGNRRWLDDGGFGVERKLYFREMIARFGYLMAVKWNLCEENVWGPDSLRAFAAYISALDPYHHPICVHTNVDDIAMYEPLYGNPDFSAASIQCMPGSINNLVETVRRRSAEAGRPWVADFDEIAGNHRFNGDVERFRKEMVYTVYFSGGCQEWIFASLLETRDLRGGNADQFWKHLWYARKFMEQNLPFWEMEPHDDLVTGESDDFRGAQVFAKPGEVYAVYLPNASAPGTLDMNDAPGTFEQLWYDPRAGEFEGAAAVVEAGRAVNLGPPPDSPAEDWVVLLRRR